MAWNSNIVIEPFAYTDCSHIFHIVFVCTVLRYQGS